MSIKEKINFDENKMALNRFILESREKISKLNKMTKLSIGGGIAVIAILIVAVAVSSSNGVYKLALDGKDVGYVNGSKQVSNIINNEKAQLKSELNAESIIFDEARAVVTKANVKKDEVTLMTDEELNKVFSNKALYSTNAWAIKVDDKVIVSASNEASAKAVIEGLKVAHKAEKSELISASFKEDVKIEQAITPVNLIMNEDNASKYILTGTTETKTYTVKSGDTMWDIAHTSKMSIYQLQAANPGFSPDKLKIGQTLNMLKQKPFVTVVTVEKVAENKDIPFKTTYEKTNVLYTGDVKIKTPGKNGQLAQVSEVTKENGIWVSTKVLSSSVITAASDAVALKGTKSAPIYISTRTSGSGEFLFPTNGKISSSFGASRSYERHKGIDIRAPKGTRINAADDGVVITATTRGGSYGKLIVISHGGGLETWYGHCDTILVKVGQKVTKGQKIGTVGITGNATGYHLHFEVKLNGISVNPGKYL